MKRPDPFVVELAKEREVRDLTTWEAERRAHLGSNVVYAWERGQNGPTLYALRKYADLLDHRIVLVRKGVDAARLARLEAEAVPERPPLDEFGLPPITPEMAAENRRLLCEALGIEDTYKPSIEAS